ncbi:hypothetical protein Dimus_023757 [Dionaea muscipula]
MESVSSSTQLLISSPLSLLITLSLFLFVLYKWVLNPSRWGKKLLPPAPPRLPLIGNIHQLGTFPHRSLSALSRRYGDLMLLYLGSKPTVVVSSAATANLIMKTHDSIFCSRPDSRFRLLNYDGKDIGSAPYGKYWRHVRSICMLHVLSPQRVRSFQRVRVEEAAELVQNISKAVAGAQGSTINLSEMFNGLTNDAICRVAFGRKYKRGDQEGESGGGGGNWHKLLKDYIELLGGLYIGDFVPALGWVNYLNGVNQRSTRIMRELDELMEAIIEQHLKREKRRGGGTKEDDEDDDDDEEKMKDLVDVLIKVQREDTANIIDRESVKGILLVPFVLQIEKWGMICDGDKKRIKNDEIDMFTAGTDTTSTTLEWAMVELLRHTKAKEKLQKEVRGVTSGKTEITEEDLEKMTYLRAVIKETLRLHPPAPLLLPRESIQDAEINGWFIPANTQVLINAWAIHRDPENWKEPDEFQPERFLDSSIDYKGQHFSFIPFGSGRRGCPGMTFATTIIELVLATLMLKFDWTLPNAENLDMTESLGVVVGRKLPLHVFATPR